MSSQPWAPTQGASGSAAAAPATDEAKPNGVAATQALPSEAPQELIDENDPRLISESLDVNPDVDSYASPAPPPDAKYRAKLKLEGFKVEGGENKDYGTGADKNKVPFYKTSISCSIIDPSGKFDGIVCYPAFGGGANTKKDRQGGSQVTTILTRVKKPDGTSWAQGFKGSQLEWIQRLVQALKTEPEIGIETAWEASCMKCAEELKPQGKYATRTTGMHHFPPEQDAAKRKAGQQFQPEIKCSANAAHGYSRARAIVVRFLHLTELK